MSYLFNCIIEWFTEVIHIYKMRGRQDKDVESANNDEEQFTTQFFNFMRKHLDIIISQVSVLEINLDFSTRFTLSIASFAPDNQKYHVNDINEPTPCTPCQRQDVKDHRSCHCCCDGYSYNAWSARPVRVCSGRSDHDQRMS
jgi:hypothetical protein